jgi:hypothetical protein
METLVRNAQEKIVSLIQTARGTVDYKRDVLPLIYPILQGIDDNKHYAHQFTMEGGFDIFVEALSLYIFNNYASNKTVSQLPLIYHAMVLIKHPFFINIVGCDKTLSEYVSYRESILDEVMKVFGDIPAALRLKALLQTKISEDVPAIQRFNFFLGFSFKPNTSGRIFKDAYRELEQQINKFVSINAPYGMDLEDTVIYTGIERKNKSLLLTEEFIYESSAFKTLKTVPMKKWFMLYERDNGQTQFKSVNKFADNDVVLVVLNYCTDEKFEDSYVSIAYSDKTFDEISVKGALLYKEAKKLLQGSSLKTIPEGIIETYLEEEFYKYISDELEPVKEFVNEYSLLQRVAIESFLTAGSIKNLRETVLRHVGIRVIFPNDTDFAFFSHYLYGLSRFYVYDQEAIVNFIINYISPGLPNLENF